MAWRTASGVFTRGVDGTVSQRLRQLLTRLDELVNWERLQRANTGQRQREMRVDVKPAKRLLDALGSPQHCYRAVHIAGTKGKGTLAAMLTAYLVKQKGFRVGTYTSPHVERIQERVRLQGACIEDEALADALESALAAADPFLQDGVPVVERPTWFDVMTAAGFLAMKTAGVEYAVIECGMGGAKDSTNVLGAEVCLLTSVALEHAEIIGPGLADIAREKAGINRSCGKSFGRRWSSCHRRLLAPLSS
jgi:dihydrofolate synthase/folylpolyglutamate synthase